MREPRIIVLPPEVAEKIAAGEVIERPASVVKELVENSLDAGATKITVETEAGGKGLIRVTDDGEGMSADEAPLAVQPHATSKLRSADDLFRIHTLGFRGEALPSIAAISRFELTTRTREAPEAARVSIEGGQPRGIDTVAAPPGTVVSVRDLFFNVPARQKFLRSDNAEAGHITDLVQRLALSHSGVTFRLVHDGREALLSPGSGDPLNAIVAVLGRPIAREMLRVPPYETERVMVTGFAGRPTLTRANRANQLLYVNGRTVRSPLYYRALDEAYRATMPAGRYPVAVAFLQIAAGDVDVNVHPSKLEVRFRDDYGVYLALLTSLQAALRPASPQQDQEALADPNDPFAGVPSVRPPAGSVREAPPAYGAAGAPPGEPRPFWPRPEDVPLEEEAAQAASEGEAAPGLPFSPSPDHPDAPSLPPGTPFADSVLGRGGAGWHHTRPSLTPRPPAGWSRDTGHDAGPTEHRTAGGEHLSPPPLAQIRPLGQARDLFIIAEGAGRLWIMDQHVAHERILFDRLTDPDHPEAEGAEPLLIPLTLQLDSRQAIILGEYREALAGMGYEIEPFGRDSFVVRSIPHSLLGRNYEQALRDTIDELADLSQGGRVQLRREQLAMAAAGRACKSAMKAGQPLSLDEMQQLLTDLGASRNPYTCPHGRPIFVAFEPEEIAKLFGEAKCE